MVCTTPSKYSKWVRTPESLVEVIDRGTFGSQKSGLGPARLEQLRRAGVHEYPHAQHSLYQCDTSEPTTEGAVSSSACVSNPHLFTIPLQALNIVGSDPLSPHRLYRDKKSVSGLG